MYIINYGTGAGNETANTIDEAKKIADAGATYTQCNITILNDDDDNEVARRRWVGKQYDHNNPDEHCDDRIDFGSFGYFADWDN